MNPAQPEDQDSQDRLAELAEKFDSQLRKRGEAAWPADAGSEQIPTILELIHATLTPGSTLTAGTLGASDFTFVVPKKLAGSMSYQKSGVGDSVLFIARMMSCFIGT